MAFPGGGQAGDDAAPPADRAISGTALEAVALRAGFRGALPDDVGADHVGGGAARSVMGRAAVDPRHRQMDQRARDRTAASRCAAARETSPPAGLVDPAGPAPRGRPHPRTVRDPEGETPRSAADRMPWRWAMSMSADKQSSTAHPPAGSSCNCADCPLPRPGTRLSRQGRSTMSRRHSRDIVGMTPRRRRNFGGTPLCVAAARNPERRATTGQHRLPGALLAPCAPSSPTSRHRRPRQRRHLPGRAPAGRSPPPHRDRPSTRSPCRRCRRGHVAATWPRVTRPGTRDGRAPDAAAGPVRRHIIAASACTASRHRRGHVADVHPRRRGPVSATDAQLTRRPVRRIAAARPTEQRSSRRANLATDAQPRPRHVHDAMATDAHLTPRHGRPSGTTPPPMTRDRRCDASAAQPQRIRSITATGAGMTPSTIPAAAGGPLLPRRFGVHAATVPRPPPTCRRASTTTTPRHVRAPVASDAALGPRRTRCMLRPALHLDVPPTSPAGARRTPRNILVPPQPRRAGGAPRGQRRTAEGCRGDCRPHVAAP